MSNVIVLVAMSSTQSFKLPTVKTKRRLWLSVGCFLALAVAVGGSLYTQATTLTSAADKRTVYVAFTDEVNPDLPGNLEQILVAPLSLLPQSLSGNMPTPTPAPQPKPSTPNTPPAKTPVRSSTVTPPTAKAFPITTQVSANKPTANKKLYVAPQTSAATQANTWRSSRPEDAATMDVLAKQPQARWFGNWNGNVQQDVDSYMDAAEAANAMPTLVLYNIPLRHCQGGGASTAEQYQTWIQQVADAIDQREALIVLEPDALALLDCLSSANQTARTAALSAAVTKLAQNPNALIYLDAGHANWVPAAEMANRLKRANIAAADGFSLNVANFRKTEITVPYGNEISSKVGNRHFVVDTGRNGAGPAHDNQWCNPLGRAAGALPTTNVAHAKVDAYLWLKPLGESDGNCNGGPGAGQWWGEYALGLMRQAGY